MMLHAGQYERSTLLYLDVYDYNKGNFVQKDQCDQIGQFIGLWATF